MLNFRFFLGIFLAITTIELINGCISGKTEQAQNPSPNNSSTPNTPTISHTTSPSPSTNSNPADTSSTNSPSPSPSTNSNPADTSSTNSPSPSPSTNSNPVTDSSTGIETPSQDDINAIKGTWKLQFSSGGVIYKGILKMNGISGEMKVEYFKSSEHSKKNIKLKMKLQNSSRGLILLGSNPIDTSTQTTYPSYIPDNFLLALNPDGLTTVKNCDQPDNCVTVDISKISE